MKRENLSGFSIIELMVVITVIGIVAMLGIPNFTNIKHRTEATVTANDLRKFADALKVYNLQNGGYPATLSSSNLPDAVSQNLPAAWKNGQYRWEYTSTDQYTFVLVYSLHFTSEQAVRVDKIIDDGNIAMGNVKMAPAGAGLVYIFEGEDSDNS
ncbi:type II secretion system protein [Coraliomargarita akajimensis]|uniref:Type II secretion system protein GspG C-terminal domain-containing protein n=1 Tax=Coraliomargarita akajimensis (strain DSM 45221 / IAM 15411 / JCM 23193 / KCTC 12865 / 04OKA010-24) TaxID=583355 RepID=D5EQK1_CORAD|nr:type II secretion system protein GspG [Coraliomargarita akajimensis]ADE55815.1 hypothetical protein Caka_2802 [Coraliomargarita akajimensis DSM 45221]